MCNIMTFGFLIQGLVRLLSTCASGSPLGAKTLLLLGISGILKDILSGSGISANSSVPPALSRPAEQVILLIQAEEMVVVVARYLCIPLYMSICNVCNVILIQAVPRKMV